MDMTSNLIQRVTIDLGMFFSLLVSAITGLTIWLAIPEGRQSGQYIFLGLTKHAWSDIHLYSSLIFLVIFFIHLALNLKLFTSMVKALIKKA
jgi:hypothetical protein